MTRFMAVFLQIGTLILIVTTLVSAGCWLDGDRTWFERQLVSAIALWGIAAGVYHIFRTLSEYEDDKR